MNIEVLKRVLKEAQRGERHNTNAETRYWCSQYKAIAEHAIEGVRGAVEVEREACAKLYEHEDVLAPVGNSTWGEAYQEGWAAGARAYRDTIRARGGA